MRVSQSRRIDNGDPLVLRNPTTGDGVAAYAVYTAVCNNPKCDCTTMWLFIRPARLAGGGEFDILEPELRGEVSADGSGLKLGEDTTGAFPGEVAAWLQEQLSDEGHRGWLRERWRRARGQVGDPAYPSGLPPEEDIEWLVPFSVVFPYEFDVTIAYERRLYLAEDHYCLQPACTCEDVLVYFVETSKGGKALGHARASVRRLRAAAIEGPPLVRRLWNALIDEYGEAPLRERFKRMRTVAKGLSPSPRIVARPKVGRNEPCPCGSGKKFKRCCGV